MPTLIDLSHHNAAPNWPQLAAGGTGGVILKASEGASFTDPQFAPWRSAAHAAGLAVGAYHFTRLLAPATEAAWFARSIGGRLQPGEFVALDLEVAAAGVDPVAWTGQWIDALAALGIGVRLLYLNQSELAGYNWAPIVARGVLLWLAAYDRNPAAPGPHGAWPAVTLKQYTDAGSVPGETGTVDVDVLFGALTDLTGGSDMTTADDVWNRTIAARNGVGPATAEQFLGYIGDFATQILAVEKANAAKLDALTTAVAQLAQAIAALPTTAAPMACQGNPHAVLTAIGQAANAAASST